MLQTGLKIGGNYLKYYGKKTLHSDLSRDELDRDNADDIYNGLKSLKGSALKAAQMLSMEKSLLPGAYVKKFSLAQFSVPPLSAPLVRKTFKKYHGVYPEELYDSFTSEAVNAASIGQVHKATREGKVLAVKIQYPGVADSICSDLSMVKPFAVKMFNLKGKDFEKYFREVEGKLLEETDYLLEVRQSKEISEACKHIPNLKFPEYYQELSSKRIITMDWMEGMHLNEFAKVNHDQAKADKIGQALWDFYMYQMHVLKAVHADPHPGNFLIDKEENLIAIDFGCVKKVPQDFYRPYFELAKKENIENSEFFREKLFELEILREDDSPKERMFFTELFFQMLNLFTRPFHEEEYSFADEGFWQSIMALGEKYSKDEDLMRMNGNRGSKHFLYINRTFFGVYNLLHDLKAKVKINNYQKYI